MKKVLLVLSLYLIAYIGVYAQPGCPNVSAGADQTLPCGTTCTNLNANYFNTGSTATYSVSSIPYTPFSYTTGTPILVGQDDIWSSVIPLPFNFCFFGNTYSNIVVGANVIITFDQTVAGGTCNWNIQGSAGIPDPALQHNSIMGPYHDIDPSIGGVGGSMQYQILGSYPCRIFVVSYNSFALFDASLCPSSTYGTETSQIAFYETTNVIEVYIKRKTFCSSWNGGLAIEGIQNATGTIAYSVPGRNNTQWNATNDAYRFTPNGPTIVTVDWLQGATNIGTTSGTASQVFTTNVCPPANATTTYTAVATYNRCDGTTVIEKDSMTVTTVPTPSAGPDQTLGCPSNNPIASMAATGTGTWTAFASNPVATTINTPSSPTTTISGFSLTGTYGYLWGTGACLDTAFVFVANNSNGGPDQTICLGIPATMAATGAGTWTALSSNPVVTIITNPSLANTTITGFTTPGVYEYQWAIGACLDTVAINVAAKPNAGIDQTICQYTSATMAGVGVGAWTALSTNPVVAVITTPSSATTTISGFTIAGAYGFVWTVNGCTDTMLVNVTAKPNAGIDQTICQYTSATMSGVGVGTWTALSTNPVVAVITTPSSATTTISGFTSAGAYGFVWTVNGCTDTTVVNVTAKPNAGIDIGICLNDIAAMAGVGVGTWTALSTNPVVATITTPSSATTTISGFTIAGAYGFVWTVNGCTDTMTVNATAKPNAGLDQTICQYTTATMAAVGLGIWSALSTNPAVANIATPSSATTTISGFTTVGTYGFVWTANGCTDTMLVNVTAKPNAGIDQTICQYTDATMAAVGVGVWTALSTNPLAVTIATPTSSTTTITGFTGAGAYSFVWTVNGCTDTMVVNVTAKPDASVDQTVCQYSPATMAGVGVGTWSALNTNPVVAIINSPSSATTAISGFTTAGAYSFVWTVNGCTDTMVVNVAAKPNAGIDQTICQYTDATMAAVGVGVWTALSTNPIVTTIATPSSAATIITGFTAAGTYGFVWTVNGCNDTMTVSVTAKPNAGIDQTICQYSTATMAGVGIGTWSALNTNPAVVIITTPSSATTTILGFTTAGAYGFVWTVNGCTDTMLVNVTAKPDAGLDGTICEYTDAAMNAVGVGIWSALSTNPVLATINNPSSATTTISDFTAAGVYSFVWTVNGCTDTVTVTVTAKPNAGVDQTICQYTDATMAGAGVGTWTALSTNPVLATINNPSSATTTITGFSVAGVYIFVWTVSGCTDTMTVTVTAKPDAGLDQIVCQYNSAIMAGVGVGTWSSLSTNPSIATIATPSSATTSIRALTVASVYGFVWAVNSCTDTMTVNVTAKPNAGIDQTICEYTDATMAAVGVGTWTALSTNPVVTTINNPTSATTSITGFTAGGAYAFIWTVNSCDDTMLVNVTPKPDAGVDQLVCQNSPATMAGVGAGTWSALSANPVVATINNPSSATTTITGFTASGAYGFVWTVNGCTDTTVVNITAKPDAGIDQTICQYTDATMASVGNGIWSELSTNPILVNIFNSILNNTSITGFSTAGVYGFIWTINGCDDTMYVTVTAKPDAGIDQTICQYTTATMAGVGAGTWSALNTNPAVAIISNLSSSTTSISGFTAVGVYNFVWTVNSCTDTMAVNVVVQPTISMADTGVCLGFPIVLTPTVVPAGGTYAWVGGQITPNIAVSPVTTTIYTVTYTVGNCFAIDTTTITVNQNPVVDSISVHNSICTANNGKVAAHLHSGTPSFNYTWSVAGNTDTLSHLPPALYTLTVTDSKGCTATGSATVGLDTATIPIALVAIHNLRCNGDNSGSITINAIDSGSLTYVWSNSAQTPNLTGLAIGTYSVVVTDQFGCIGAAQYNIRQQTKLMAGVPTFVNPTCFGYSDGTATETATGGSGNYHFAWSSSPVQNTATAIGLPSGSYTVSVSDDSNCIVTAPVILTDPAAITFGASTTVDVSCFQNADGSATVVPMNGVGNYNYSWNDPAQQTANPAIALKGGNYTVTVTDTKGCTATMAITINRPDTLTVAVSETDLNCYQSHDGTVTATPTGGNQGYLYLWNTGPTTASITGLDVGFYSLVVTDSKGCTASGNTTVNEPAQLMVTATSLRTHCPDSKDGSITAIGTGGTGAITYSLTNSMGQVLESGNTTGIFLGLGYGIDTVKVTDAHGCSISYTINVPRAPFNSYTSSSDATSCYGSQYHDGIIHVQGYSITNGPFQYSVDSGALQFVPDFFDLMAGTHRVRAVDFYGCDTTFEVIVGEPLPASVQILPGDSTIQMGQSLQLNTVFGPYPIDSIKGYIWAENAGLSCSDCPNPIANPYTGPNLYTVSVTYNKGCIAVSTINIAVLGDPPVYIPNAFTPNGDNVNDQFIVYGEGIKTMQLMVFNRWGEKVYESDNQSEGWDGSYKGVQQPPGVYTYIVDLLYLNNRKRLKEGSITLIR